jgi:hypothetical protein
MSPIAASNMPASSISAFRPISMSDCLADLRHGRRPARRIPVERASAQLQLRLLLKSLRDAA